MCCRQVLQVTLSKVSKFVKRPSRLSSATGSRSPLTSLSEPAGEEEVSSTPSPKQYEDLLALVSTLQQQLVDVERAKGVLERNVRDLLQSSVVGIQAYSAPPTPTTSFRCVVLMYLSMHSSEYS